MIEIDSTRDRERDDERKVQEKKQQQKLDLEKKMQEEPMKTFQAKLTEKTAHELTSKETQVYKQAQEEKQTTEEKKSLLNQVISSTTEKASEQDKMRIAALKQQGEREYQEKDDKIKDKRLDEKRADSKDGKESKQVHDSGKKGGGEVSEEGYKRVAEREQGEGGGGFGQGFGGGEDSDNNSFGPDSKKQLVKGQVANNADSKGVFHAALRLHTKMQGGFDKNARDFSDRDLDEIVSQVQYGLNEYGEEEFSVTLTDDYYAGLKILSQRTENGVVLQIQCPNVAIRSTFLKYRHRVYHHLMARGIEVHRVEVR